jgi:protein subunit release factor A
MGKQVTYGIGYTQADPIQEGYKYYINKYKEYLASHKTIKAAKIAIELTAWLAEESDEVDDPEDPTFQQYLQVAIKHCKRAIVTLERTIDEHLLPKYVHFVFL